MTRWHLFLLAAAVLLLGCPETDGDDDDDDASDDDTAGDDDVGDDDVGDDDATDDDTGDDDTGDPCEGDDDAPTDGLVLHLPLDGTGIDVGGNDIHGQVEGATPTADRLGCDASALLFDGIDDHIRVPFATELDFQQEGGTSWGLWVMTTAHPDNFATFLGMDGSYQEFALSITGESDGSFFADTHTDAGWEAVDGQGALAEDVWHHLMVTLDDTTISLYRDGALKDEKTISPVVWMPADYDLLVGAWESLGGPDLESHFQGVLDEVRVYDRTLSAAEVQQVYEAALHR